jgi:hypothetical protein
MPRVPKFNKVGFRVTSPHMDEIVDWLTFVSHSCTYISNQKIDICIFDTSIDAS